MRTCERAWSVAGRLQRRIRPTTTPTPDIAAGDMSRGIKPKMGIVLVSYFHPLAPASTAKGNEFLAQRRVACLAITGVLPG